MSNRFEAFQKAPPGDTKAPFKLDLKGFVPFAGRSGHLDVGNYEWEIAAASAQPHKTEKRNNAQFVLVSVGPSGCTGVSIVVNQAGPRDDDPKATGENMMKRMVWGVASHMGKVDEFLAAGARAYTMGWFVGKRLYASVVDGEGEWEQTSQFDRVLSGDEYRAAPGPTGGAKRQASAPRQERVPEVAPDGNGQGASGVDALLHLPSGGGAADDNAPPF